MDYDSIMFEADFQIAGIRSGEHEWADAALMKVYSKTANIANKFAIDWFNRWWNFWHPGVRVNEGPWERKYLAEYDKFMRVFSDYYSRKYGKSTDGTRIVRIPSMYNAVEIYPEQGVGYFHGVIEDC